MRFATALAVAVVLAPALVLAQQHIVLDVETDFATLKTFAIREGRATTSRPEIDNDLIFRKVADAIRKSLVAKGMTESATRADVTVGFTLGEDRPNGPSVAFNRGTLAIDFRVPDGDRMVWQGVYRDDTNNPARVADNLPSYVQKVLSKYPPKKKR